MAKKCPACKRELPDNDEYVVSTCLQDGGWERCDGYPSLRTAIKVVKKMIRGPLGTSCMYEVTQNGKLIRSNDELFRIAGYER